MLYHFKGDKDGNFPDVGLTKDKNGALYGTTSYGGGSAYCKDGTRPPGAAPSSNSRPPAPASEWTKRCLPIRRQIRRRNPPF